MEKKKESRNTALEYSRVLGFVFLHPYSGLFIDGLIGLDLMISLVLFESFIKANRTRGLRFPQAVESESAKREPLIKLCQIAANVLQSLCKMQQRGRGAVSKRQRAKERV